MGYQSPAYLHALLEQTADSLENLQRILVRSEESRIGTNTTLAGLADRLGMVGEHIKAGQALMARMAENQMELKPSLTRLATDAGLRSRLGASALATLRRRFDVKQTMRAYEALYGAALHVPMPDVEPQPI